MATTVYFEETIHDQNNRDKIDVEFGRSSFYAQCKLDNGKIGADSIYIKINDATVIMDLATAKKFVHAAIDVGMYHGLID